MPQTYLVVRTISFDTNYSIEPSVQTDLIDTDGLALTEGDPETTMIFDTNKTILNQTAYIYHVHHDYKVKKTGKVFDRYFSYFLDPKDFLMFYFQDDNILFIRAQKDVAKNFLNYLSSSFPSFEYEIIEPNLKTIMAKVDGLKGAWIAVRKDGVNTEAYFGSEVENDEDVRAGVNGGAATYITFIYTYANKQIYCGISKYGNITIYDDILLEEQKQDLMLEIYNRLIK